MTERAADVPPGPYFHGTRREIPIGAELCTLDRHTLAPGGSGGCVNLPKAPVR